MLNLQQHMVEVKTLAGFTTRYHLRQPQHLQFAVGEEEEEEQQQHPSLDPIHQQL
jgi:hypothetical protein